MSAHLAQIRALLPPGAALPREEGNRLEALLRPAADEMGRIDGRIEALLAEVNPGAALELLEDYERVLGEDPCLGPAAALPVAVRQALAVQRWTAGGGATPAYFIGLAATLGIEISIEESQPSIAGVLECGGELVPEEGIFEWVVTLPAPELLLEFECGATEAGSPLGDFTPSTTIECLIRRQAPAHTTVYFRYEES